MNKYSKKFFQACGVKGGSVKSEKKTKSCRLNAKRPRTRKLKNVSE